MTHSVHATADEIFTAVNRSYPRASRATVYNNLHALERASLVRQVSVDGKAARFDANVDRHHHFICDSCGKVEDVPWFEPPRISYRVRDFEVMFRGPCNICFQASKTESKASRKSSR